jgi:predicted SAM-dependent methyltransferase
MSVSEKVRPKQNMDIDSYLLAIGPKLNLGCGPVQPAGWVNIDASNRARLASRLPYLDRLFVKLRLLSSTEFGPNVRIHDLVKPLPFESESVSCIYGGEVWEHLEYSDSVRLTGESFRVLKPGGVLRVCVPDGVEFWRRYLELFDEIWAKPKNQRSALALRKHVQMYFNEICTRKSWFGSMEHMHKWQFDEIQLVELFESHGFVEVARMPFHQSRISDISTVEVSDLLIVEGIKPRT